jgi:hypothetical protein
VNAEGVWSILPLANGLDELIQWQGFSLPEATNTIAAVHCHRAVRAQKHPEQGELPGLILIMGI